MLTANHDAIRYAPDYFDESFIRFIASDKLLLGAEPETAPEEPEALIPPEQAVDPEALFEEIWANLKADPDFSSQAEALEEQRAETYKHALSRVLVPPQTDKELGAALAVPYDIIELPDGSFTHRLGDVDVLQIPGTLAGSKEKSARTAMIISAARVAVDTLMILATACGVNAAVMQRSAARTIANTASRQSAALARASAKMAQAAKLKDNVKKMKAIGAVMYKGLDNWAIAKGIVSEMSRLERGLTIATVTFNAGLAFASGSASVWLNVALLLTALGSFAIDLGKLATDYTAWRAA